MAHLLRNGRVVDPANGVDGIRDVLISDSGIVAEVGMSLSVGPDADVMDCTDLVVCPGLIDMHVHLRVPGQEYKEDVATGTAAAAAGGFTAIACQPNTVPPIDHPAVVRQIQDLAQGAVARVYVVGAVSPGLRHDQLCEMAELRDAGVVGIGDDAFPVADSGFLRRAMQYCKMLNLPFVAHCEDKTLTGDGVMHEGAVSTLLGLRGIPRAAENCGTARNLLLAAETGCRLHVLHVSTKESVELLRQAKAQGAPVTGETCPQYLSLTDSACEGYNTNAKMSPSLRTQEDIEAIKQGLADGTIDAVATDHAPHAAHEKEQEFARAPFGMVGLETALGLVMTHLVQPGILTLSQLVDKMSAAPARILGIPGGSLSVGDAADITVFDPTATWTVDVNTFRSKGRNTVLHGQTLTGRAIATFVGGQEVAFMKTAHLVLADGTVYTGIAAGADGTAVGETVFCTSMTGYQEILTDPSYAGQIVTLTYPLIGNYGTTDADWESGKVQASALVVREAAAVPSHWRAQGSLRDFLAAHGVVSLAGIDTRDLTRRLRSHGVMMGAVSTEATPEELTETLHERADYGLTDFVRQVTTDAPYVWPSATGEARYKIALLDCGVKHNILRSLASLGCQISVFPAHTSAADILATDPDGVFLSPGPGDPALLSDIVQEVRTLAESKPLMGICLGNQLLGCAYGGHTFKLPFGHRGANHPVRDVASGRVYITSQNHGYALADSPYDDDLRVAQISLNDGTVEGLRHARLPVFSIQYHPEASPGPADTGGYFAEFLRMIDAHKG